MLAREPAGALPTSVRRAGLPAAAEQRPGIPCTSGQAALQGSRAALSTRIDYWEAEFRVREGYGVALACETGTATGKLCSHY